MLENKTERITLKCDIEGWGKQSIKYLSYVSKELLSPTCIRILEYTYDTPKNFPKDEMYAAKYCATPL